MRKRFAKWNIGRTPLDQTKEGPPNPASCISQGSTGCFLEVRHVGHKGSPLSPVFLPPETGFQPQVENHWAKGKNDNSVQTAGNSAGIGEKCTCAPLLLFSLPLSTLLSPLQGDWSRPLVKAVMGGHLFNWYFNLDGLADWSTGNLKALWSGHFWKWHCCPLAPGFCQRNQDCHRPPPPLPPNLSRLFLQVEYDPILWYCWWLQ